MKNKFKLKITSFWLHIIAMVAMICDHLWGSFISGNDWLTCVGRISFPIFAFMIVEGYFKTKNFKKYLYRILIFAIISEIPFNLMVGSRIFYPVHQNVLWTFLISLILIHINEKIKLKKNILLQILTIVFTLLFGNIIGLITMVDYYHAGILTVLVFYFFRQKRWWCYLLQFICLWYINVEVLGGLIYELNLFGLDINIHQQGFALFSLIFIWMYNGKQGWYNEKIKYFYYLFYPVHILLLGILKLM